MKNIACLATSAFFLETELLVYNVYYKLFLQLLPLEMSLGTTVTSLMKQTTKWCWWSGNWKLYSGMESKYSGTTSRWGRVKLLPSAATPPCQLTSRPGQLEMG